MESNSVCNHATDKQNRTRPICSIKSMITDQIRRHEGLLPINHNHYNFRENKCILFFVKERLIPIIERNTSQIHPFWKTPSLVKFGRISGCCYGYCDKLCDWWLE